MLQSLPHLFLPNTSTQHAVPSHWHRADLQGAVARCFSACLHNLLNANQTVAAFKLGHVLAVWCLQARVRRQLQDEQAKVKRAEADLRRLQLQNPSLRLQAIQNIMPAADEQQVSMTWRGSQICGLHAYAPE